MVIKNQFTGVCAASIIFLLLSTNFDSIGSSDHHHSVESVSQNIKNGTIIHTSNSSLSKTSDNIKSNGDKFSKEDIDLDKTKLNSSSKLLPPPPPPSLNIFSVLEPSKGTGSNLGEPWTLKKLRTWAMCNACGIFFDYAATLIRRWKRPLKSMQSRLKRICPMVPMFSSEADSGGSVEVCLGLVEHFTPTVFYIVQNSPQLQGNAFCGFVLQQFGCDYSDPYLEWSVNITSSKNSSNQSTSLSSQPPSTSRPTQINSPVIVQTNEKGTVTSSLENDDDLQRIHDLEEQLLDQQQRQKRRFTEEGITMTTSNIYDNASEFIKISHNNKLTAGQHDKRETKRKKLFKILHLTDLHVDLNYKPGAISVCREKVICCRVNSSRPSQQPESPFGGSGSGSGEAAAAAAAAVESGIGSDSVSRAGFFADSHACGSPLTFLMSTLEHISRVHPDIGMVYMSGDLVPHDVHGGTKEGNLEVMGQVSNLIRKYFPSIPVIPVLGNHDTHPVNFFSPPGVPKSVDTRWVYNLTLTLWKNWIPSTSRDTYLKEGYYSKEMDGNLRIIVLNTNMCYGFNFWGVYNIKDPGDQLAWLIQELDEAEEKGQKVHIVGHVPPGCPDCNKVWSRNFYKILSRYHAIIKGQFYGHLHKDTLKIFYSPDDPTVAINSAFISPAFTAYKSHNPTYKIFYADGSFSANDQDYQTWDILDNELYIFDLDRANKIANDADDVLRNLFSSSSQANERMMASHWIRMYRATTAYGIPDTRPSNLALLVSRMAKSKPLFDLYYQHYEKALPHQKDKPITLATLGTSAADIQTEILCDIVRPYAQHEVECDQVRRTVDEFVRKNSVNFF